MDCVICKGKDIVNKVVEEQLKINKDLVFIPLEVLVCNQCGERYYDQVTMRKLEKLEKDVLSKKIRLKEVGHVLKVA